MASLHPSIGMYPMKFQPALMERVWGGRALGTLFRKQLPEGTRIGESWEISDRPEGETSVANGILAGYSLGQLVREFPQRVLGASFSGSFPLLAKLLDARETLSVQVHPPANLAASLGGYPKTEVWYVAAADPGARIYAGLSPGTRREEFVARLQEGTVEACLHQIPVAAGDAMFLPSGRIHALGAGVVVFEIQQNSDTTFRLFDWNRVGLDGKPRTLHVDASLRCIDFSDFAPALVPQTWSPAPGSRAEFRSLCDPLAPFEVQEWRWLRQGSLGCRDTQGPVVLAVTVGRLQVRSSSGDMELGPGEFGLLPASVMASRPVCDAEEHSVVLVGSALPSQGFPILSPEP